MNKNQHITKIDVLRGGSIISSVLFNPESKKNDSSDFQVSSTASVNTFPTLSIKSTYAEMNEPLMHFSKGDLIRFSVSNYPSDEFNILFEGELKKKSMNFVQETQILTIELDAIHSFYNLSLMQLSSSFNFSGMTFGQFINELISMARIQSIVYIGEELSNTIITGASYKTNLYRLFKELCLILNAVVSFNADNSVSIDYRTSKIESMKSQDVKEINSNDILSSESKYEV